MRLLSLEEFVLLKENSSYSDYVNEINNSIKYHIENELSITESIFRIGSDAYCDFVNELRSLNEKGLIKLSDDDKFILENLKTGTKAVFKERGSDKYSSVDLDSPKRGGDKKFYVYRDSGKKTEDGKIIAYKIQWGDPNATVKNCDDEARKSFLARQQCDKWTLAKDGDSPRWWACNVHKFWKQLGLTCSKPW